MLASPVGANYGIVGILLTYRNIYLSRRQLFAASARTIAAGVGVAIKLQRRSALGRGVFSYVARDRQLAERRCRLADFGRLSSDFCYGALRFCARLRGTGLRYSSDGDSRFFGNLAAQFARRPCPWRRPHAAAARPGRIACRDYSQDAGRDVDYIDLAGGRLEPAESCAAKLVIFSHHSRGRPARVRVSARAFAGKYRRRDRHLLGDIPGHRHGRYPAASAPDRRAQSADPAVFGSGIGRQLDRTGLSPLMLQSFLRTNEIRVAVLPYLDGQASCRAPI